MVTELESWCPMGREAGGACFVDGALPAGAVELLRAMAERESQRFAKKPRRTADVGRLAEGRDTDAERAAFCDLDG